MEKLFMCKASIKFEWSSNDEQNEKAASLDHAHKSPYEWSYYVFN